MLVGLLWLVIIVASIGFGKLARRVMPGGQSCTCGEPDCPAVRARRLQGVGERGGT